MFKKFDDEVSGVLTLEFVGAAHLSFGENVVKSDSGFEMKFNLADSANNLFFERDDKRGIVLIGNV